MARNGREHLEVFQPCSRANLGVREELFNCAPMRCRNRDRSKFVFAEPARRRLVHLATLCWKNLQCDFVISERKISLVDGAGSFFVAELGKDPHSAPAM